MCFAIPKKVISVAKNNALIETGENIKMGKELKAKKGDYVRVVGNIAVDVISKSKGLQIRQVLEKLNKDDQK